MKKLRTYLALLVVAFLVSVRPEPLAYGATVSPVVDQKLCTGSATSGGGTLTCDYATTTDRAHRVLALVGMSNLSASHLQNGGFITCEAVFENKNGTLSLTTAQASSNNPSNNSTTTFVAAHAQGLDAAFVGAGPSTCVWSVSTTNARVTVSNLGATTADVTILVQVFTWGSQ